MFYINTLPAVPRDVENLLEKAKTEPSELLSSVCTGGGICKL
jgi:hypothetical protein